jgi:hypothetical protein
MGYYSDDTQERPFVRVKTILHRNDPILTCAPQHKPVDETRQPDVAGRQRMKVLPILRHFLLYIAPLASDKIR